MRVSWLAAMPALIACCVGASSQAAQTDALEDIYIFRTHMTDRIQGPIPGCAEAGFEVRYQDSYAFHAVETDGATGLITNAEAGAAPGFTACVGVIDDTGGFDMFVTGDVADTAYVSTARCQIEGGNMPAPGLAVLSCRGLLRGLAATYSGGFLTSSTQPPMGDGEPVPGYVSTSIVTVRLWRAQ